MAIEDAVTELAAEKAQRLPQGPTGRRYGGQSTPGGRPRQGVSASGRAGSPAESLTAVPDGGSHVTTPAQFRYPFGARRRYRSARLQRHHETARAFDRGNH